jgi:hypothetical protein
MRENDFSSVTKNQALKRANNRCERCWSIRDLECHHILSLQLGGQSTLENCIILCHHCHNIAPHDPYLLQNFFLQFSSTKELLTFYNTSSEEEALKSFCLEAHINFQETLHKIRTDPKSHVNAIKDGMEKCFQQKGHTGFNIPYGYDYINGKLVVKKTESFQVKKIYDMYLLGKSMKKIAKMFNDQGIPTKQNKTWGPQTVALILKNPLYIGFVHWEKNVNQGNHEPLVSQDTFNQVQKLILKNKNKKRSFKYITK